MIRRHLILYWLSSILAALIFVAGAFEWYGEPRHRQSGFIVLTALAVAAVVVVPRPDPLWQEVGVAFIVPKPGMNIDGLPEWLAKRLANYKRPKSYVIQNALPLLPIGKVDRTALRNLAARQVLDGEN